MGTPPDAECPKESFATRGRRFPPSLHQCTERNTIMRIIKNGKVYNLSYGEYEEICKLPSGWMKNEVGNFAPTEKSLRRDNASKLFYICTETGSYGGRESYRIEPVTLQEAMKVAEDFVEYEAFIKYFGDPEGTDAGLARERDDAIARAENLERTKDVWYNEYKKRGDELTKLREEHEAEMKLLKDQLAAAQNLVAGTGAEEL